MSTNLSMNVTLNDKLLKNLHRHFIFHNESSIQDILKIKNGIWQHPLIKSKNKCLICCEDKNIYSNHIQVNKLEFFIEKKIKLKHKQNFKERITNRHINSDSEINYNTYMSNPSYDITDTNIFLGGFYTANEENMKLIMSHREHQKSIGKTDIINKTNVKQYKDEKVFLDIPSRSTPFTKYDITLKNENLEKRGYLEQIFTHYDKEWDNERDHILSIKQNNPSQADNNPNKPTSVIKIDYCDICFGDIKNKFILSCGDFYCKECIKMHVRGCLQNISLFKNLRCPKTICNDKIREIDIEKLFSNEEFEIYLNSKAKFEGFSDNNMMPCPIPDCEGFGKKAEIRDGFIKCSKNHKFCERCLKEAHVNKKCIKTTDYSMQIMSQFKQIKKCPNCKTLVEKQEGCNNVTCGNIWCNFTFCWVCMKSYDKNHYSNPLSPCFGMQELQSNSRFAKHKCLRISKCLLIFILMLAILPIVILLFSFFALVGYILAFVLDGSAVKNLKLKTERKQKIFRFLIYSIYSWISIFSLPVGYWALFVLIISSPFIFIYKKIKHVDNE